MARSRARSARLSSPAFWSQCSSTKITGTHQDARIPRPRTSAPSTSISTRVRPAGTLPPGVEVDGIHHDALARLAGEEGVARDTPRFDGSKFTGDASLPSRSDSAKADARSPDSPFGTRLEQREWRQDSTARCSRHPLRPPAGAVRTRRVHVGADVVDSVARPQVLSRRSVSGSWRPGSPLPGAAVAHGLVGGDRARAPLDHVQPIDLQLARQRSMNPSSHSTPSRCSPAPAEPEQAKRFIPRRCPGRCDSRASSADRSTLTLARPPRQAHDDGRRRNSAAMPAAPLPPGARLVGLVHCHQDHILRRVRELPAERR